MSEYQVADGHDNEAGFVTVNPQPASEGLLYPERVFAVDGTPIDKGLPYVIWRYRDEITEDVYYSLLQQFSMGNIGTINNDVTIHTLVGHQRTTYANYNGKLIKPGRPEYRRGFYRNVEFWIVGLVGT